MVIESEAARSEYVHMRNYVVSNRLESLTMVESFETT